VFVVDTNLLVYAAIKECPEHAEARPLIERWRAGSEPWFLAWPIVYEFLRVTTHRRVFQRPLALRDAWSFIAALRVARRVTLLAETERHAETIRELVTEYPRVGGNLVHDLHIAALMKEHGVGEIRTADTDFHQFTFLRVVNPLVPRTS
jgi:uncharacterized protein